jgi:hypothetical protein
MQTVRAFRLHPLVRAALIVISGLAGAAASAHHSFAMYDREHPVTIAGEVREFQWTNPHVWIQVLVPKPGGGTEEWSVECTSVNYLTRWGWTRRTLKPGDKVALKIYPLKDGSKGGSLAELTSINGNPPGLVRQE